MYPAMTGRETVAFESFVRASRKFLEFGCGGTTVLAAKHVAECIIAVDSSEEWLSKVTSAIESGPELILKRIDIGPIREWGYPCDETAKERWPSYSLEPWTDPKSAECDLFLIDGRFRVACFCEAIVRARFGSIVLFHDFDETRPVYHVSLKVARRIAIAERLSAFVKDTNVDIDLARQLATEHRLDPR